MSFNEIAVIIACLLAGYWLVSKIMDVKKDEREREEKFRNGGFSGSDERSHQTGNQGASNKSSDQNSSKDDYDCSKVYMYSNWHLILGVSRNATQQEIASAYKSKIRQYHPDKCSGLGDELKNLAEKKAKQINAAYQFATETKGN